MLGFEIGLAGIVLLVVVGLALILYLVPIPLWIAAWASGAYVGLFTLIGMRFRRVPPWVARSGAFMLTPFSPRLAQLVRFATEVSIRDLIAPQVGKRRLGDWFRDEARAAAAR